MDDRLRDEILAVHRSAVIPEQNRAYMVAALGCKGDDAERAGLLDADRRHRANRSSIS